MAAGILKHCAAPRSASLVVVAAFVVAACGPGGEAADPASGDAVMARVGGRPIFASDVRLAAAADGASAEGEALDTASPLFRRALDEVVDGRLLAREGERLGLDRDPSLRRRLQAARDKILADAVVARRVERAVAEPAVRNLYDEQRKLTPVGEELHVRQIVLADAAAAEAVMRLAARSDFAALAALRSTDIATRADGGDLGWLASDAMPDGFGPPLAKARAGEVVGPVKVEGGYAVLKLEARRPEQTAGLDEARPQIVRFLTYDAIRDLLARLRKQTPVELTLPAAAGVQPAEPASAPASRSSPALRGPR